MGRQKQVRFADNQEKYNIVQVGKESFGKLKGRWSERHFGNNNPLIAELGCGKGEYTFGLAQHHSDHNFVGVDIKGYRIWVGAQACEAAGLQNAAFLRTEIENIDMHFGQGELAEIWIPFPDPRPKGRDEKRRLTSPRFLELYRQLLVPGGMVRLKTDNRPLFDYTLEQIAQIAHTDLRYTFDLYNDVLLEEHLGIQTNFERKYLGMGQPIHYLRFNFS